MLDKIKDRMRSINKKYLLINFMVAFVGAFVIGYVIRLVISNFEAFLGDAPFRWNLVLLVQPTTWFMGAAVVLVLWAVFWVGGGHMRGLFRDGLFGGDAEKAMVEGVLENKAQNININCGI